MCRKSDAILSLLNKGKIDAFGLIDFWYICNTIKEEIIRIDSGNSPIFFKFNHP
jgi:hypothetical protein